MAAWSLFRERRSAGVDVFGGRVVGDWFVVLGNCVAGVVVVLDGVRVVEVVDVGVEVVGLGGVENVVFGVKMAKSKSADFIAPLGKTDLSLCLSLPCCSWPCCRS